MTSARAALAAIVHVDREKLAWKMPLRASIVILLLITAFTLTGHPLEGVPVTVGALFAAIADVGEHVGHRWRTMLWTTAWLMVVGVIAEAVSDTPWLTLGVSVVVAAVCGFVGALGPRTALIGTLALVTMTIFAGIPEISSGFIPNALLIGLGGLAQTAVTCVPPLLRDPRLVHKPEDFGPVLPRLRAHLSASDPFARHAIRLALAILLSTAIALTWRTPHSYWIPMTVAWITKPDRHGTVDKVVGRVVGTCLGLLLIAFAVDVLGMGRVGMFLSVAVGSMLCLMFVWANYAIAVMGVTILVAALFAPAFAASVSSTLWLRVLDTLIAGAIALLVSIGWRARE